MTFKFVFLKNVPLSVKKKNPLISQPISSVLDNPKMSWKQIIQK